MPVKQRAELQISIDVIIEIKVSRSRGTAINSYDLTTCSSWVQAPNGLCTPIRRTDYPALRGNQLVTECHPHKWYRQSLADNGC